MSESIKQVLKEVEDIRDQLFWTMYDNELEDDRLIKGKIEGISVAVLHIKKRLSISDTTLENSTTNEE